MNKNTPFLILIFLICVAIPHMAFSAEENDPKIPGLIEFTKYCECTFSDGDPRKFSSKKLFIGWTGVKDDPDPFFQLNKREYKNFKLQYEKLSEKMGSYGEFLLQDGNDKIKGNLKVTQNCENASYENCEYTSYEGKVEVTINGNTSVHDIHGGCGC